MWSSEYKRPCLVWYSDIYLPCLIFWYLPTHIFNLLYQAWYQSIENVKIYEKHETYKCFIVITIVLKSMEKKSGYNITASELYCSNSLIIRPWFFNIYYCILNLFVFLFFLYFWRQHNWIWPNSCICKCICIHFCICILKWISKCICIVRSDPYFQMYL